MATIKRAERGAICLGAMRLTSIDVGFDLRLQDIEVVLPDDPEGIADLAENGEDDRTGVGFDGRDGERYIVRGTVDEIRSVLREHGYKVQ